MIFAHGGSGKPPSDAGLGYEPSRTDSTTDSVIPWRSSSFPRTVLTLCKLFSVKVGREEVEGLVAETGPGPFG